MCIKTKTSMPLLLFINMEICPAIVPKLKKVLLSLDLNSQMKFISLIMVSAQRVWTFENRHILNDTTGS